ncbi:MAG: hypothetical protein OXU29_05705, partial [Gammaproteobacteria bacterium]|nr:hypothetical protein [Gammaproteobacteria bacterium]
MVAVAPAQAQTSRTLTVSATGSGGDRDATAPGLQVNEGDIVTVTYTLNGLTGGLLAADTTISGTAARDGSDFTTTAQSPDGDYQVGAVILRTSILSRSSTINITNDTVSENDETIILTVIADTEAGGVTDSITVTPATLTVTILGNDGQAFSIAAGAASVAEDVGNITFTVTMIGEALASGNRTVNWAAAGAGITAADVDSTSGTLTFTNTGQMTITLAV